MLMIDILEAEGYLVRAFSEADSAWYYIQQHGFDADLLITDLKMTGTVNGLQLVHNLHDASPNVPVIVASGFHAEPSDLDDDRVYWLDKPFSVHQLQAICYELTCPAWPPSCLAG